MDLSAAQHQLHHHFHYQEMGSHPDPQSLDSVIGSSKPAPSHQQQEKKPRPPDNEPQKCRRCESTNTKFCYYNNYSLTQPRYFCKSCRRYWTKGGTLRNVPVGGGCRKNKRSSSSASAGPASPSPSPSFSSPASLLKGARGKDMVAMAASNPLFSGLHLPAFSSASSYCGGLGFDVMGNGNVTDCDGVLAHPHGGSFLDSLRSGAFLDHHNSGGLFQNLCYGFGIGNETDGGGGGGSSNCVSGISEEMGLVPYEDVVSSGGGAGSTATTTAVTVTTMKQEGNESRALWGFPWQVNGDRQGSLGAGLAGPAADLEPVRESWNGLIGNSALHGLLNSPALNVVVSPK